MRLVDVATDVDGVSPLSEHVLLHLRYGGDQRARNVLLTTGGELTGYAHLDPTDPVEGPSGEMVIDPAHRGKGQGLAVVRTLLAEADGHPLRLWAHGDAPAAAKLAKAAGFQRIRALWQMRRSLRSRLDEPSYPAGVSVRTFVVGQDEDSWVDLNRRAFAKHPEQGAWTREDLRLREREPWFDPDGFFLAERAGNLIGFHWTKIHGGYQPASGGPGGRPPGQAPRATAQLAEGQQARSPSHDHDPIGEVYVVGIDPDQRGGGLGRALTLSGLRYLRSAGLAWAMLYVDETNTPAIRLYESLGFTHHSTDVMFRHP
jgi:mycothiol synthase